MVQCELCGSETTTPRSIKIEGAELDVCESCANLGSEVSGSDSEGSDTKYSTSNSSASNTTTTSQTSTSSGTSSSRSGGDEDLFESLGDLAQDYDDRIRRARENRGLSQAELADELNEKRSLIARLERGETLPSDAVQSKLERFLDIDLEGGSADASEWQSDSDATDLTLGEMAERKD